MDLDRQQLPHDLVGGPFAVIESDPGVFTSLIRKLGVRGLELAEIYDIEPWAVDHLNPHGLIFCYLCTDENDPHEDAGVDDDIDDDNTSRRVWFANQLSDDACASQAILNVLLNCPHIDLGDELREFQESTEDMSSVMKGLAIANSSFIREAQNSLARPADIRGALHTIAATTLDASKAKAKAQRAAAQPPPTKKRKTATPSKRKPPASPSAADDAGDPQETYHFIGYVPAHGRVWELDGLRAGGPLEVGACAHAHADADTGVGWMDAVRPALRMRMARAHIRYSLLAVVRDAYARASDALELRKRERAALERRLAEAHPGWAHAVDPALLASAEEAFATVLRPAGAGAVFGTDFGARKMERELAVLEMPARGLPGAWEACVRGALPEKIAVEDEVARAREAHTEHVSRTFDYAPFITAFITCMHEEGLLEPALNRKVQAEANEQMQTKAPAKSKAKAKGKR
ncbi:cysteine proteinase [Amylocystis lapponica]|nr:cysteine proteinase [Amylocystis lapponica]